MAKMLDCPGASMALTSAADLLTQLQRYSLLEPTQFEELSEQPPAGDVLLLARDLVRRGWLTPFQANALFKGQANELVLGSYVLLERLGEGGMGQVFKARHVHLGRVVALKQIRSEQLADPDAVARFRREIRSVAKLSHPHIVNAFDADEVHGVHFFTMEYVDGYNLGQLVQRHGPLPVVVACEYMRQAALGLQHAHECGLIHRDIKPSNLLVATAGLPASSISSNPLMDEGKPGAVVKILDLGLARSHRTPGGPRSGTLTEAGMVVGTPDFIAPEQARNSRLADIRSDLYSLGCTFYFSLTGKLPFNGETATETMFQHVMEEARPIELLRPEVPIRVAAIVRKLMAKRPEERYQTPAELALALDKNGAALPPAASANAPTERLTVAPMLAPLPLPAKQPVPRQRTVGRPWPLLGGLTAAFLGSVGLLLFLLLRQPSPAPSSAPVAMPPATPPLVLPAVLAPVLPGQPGEVVQILGDPQRRHWGTVRSVGVSADGRLILSAGADHFIHLWDLRTGQRRATYDGHGGKSVVAVFAPDGRGVLSGGADRSVRWWEVATGLGRPLQTDCHSAVNSVAITADGNTAAVGCDDGTIHILNLPDGNERQVLRGHQGGGLSLAFAPDGGTLFSGGKDRAVKAWDPATGRERLPLPEFKVPVHAVAVSPDGRFLAVAGPDSVVRVRDLQTSREHVQITSGGLAVESLAFAPDSRTLVVGSQQGGLQPFDLATGQPRLDPLVSGHENNTTALAYAPDGQTVVSGSHHGQVRLWSPTSGEERLPLIGHFAAVQGVAYLPDGKTLVSTSTDRTVRFWDIATGRQRQLIENYQTKLPELTTLAVAPDGQKLAVGSDGGMVYLWDARSGQSLAAVRATDQKIYTLAFSPDSRYLAAASADQTARIWELAGADPLERLVLRGHTKPVRGLAFAPDGQTLATFGDDRDVKVWELPGGRLLHTWPQGEGCHGSMGVAFAPDGRTLAIGWWSSAVKLWNVNAGRDQGGLYGLGITSSLAYSPNGQSLVAGCETGQLFWWDSNKQVRVKDWQLPGLVKGLAFAPDNQQLAVGTAGGPILLMKVPAR